MNLVFISDRLPAGHPAMVDGRGRILTDYGMGHQMPPGLLMFGGALRGRVAVTLEPPRPTVHYHQGGDYDQVAAALSTERPPPGG
jgi:hypothetical protein